MSKYTFLDTDYFILYQVLFNCIIKYMCLILIVQSEIVLNYIRNSKSLFNTPPTLNQRLNHRLDNDATINQNMLALCNIDTYINICMLFCKS